MRIPQSHRSAAVLLAAGMLGAGTFTGAGPASAAESKIGYVVVEKLVGSYGKTQAAEDGLEKQGKQKEAELQGRVTELKKMREGLELLNDQARDAKQREIDQKSDELQRFRANAGRDLTRERQKVLGDILKDVRQAVDEFAKANGFTLIVRDDALLYAQPAADVTDGVLKILNSRGAAKHEGGKSR